MKRFVILLSVLLFIGSPMICCAETSDTYINEEYQAYAYEIAGIYSICPELILAMIETESSGMADVVSDAGCVGLMQISPRCHKDRMERLGVTDLTDPYGNILVGCDFIAELFEKYIDINVVLAGYNAGESSEAIRKAKEGYWTGYAKKVASRSEELERIHEDMPKVYKAKNIKTGEEVQGTSKYLAETLDVGLNNILHAARAGTSVRYKWLVENIGYVQHEKVCGVCGAEFKSDYAYAKYCSEKCARGASALLKSQKQEMPKIKSIAEISAEARKAGMTYGQYVVKMGL